MELLQLSPGLTRFLHPEQIPEAHVMFLSVNGALVCLRTGYLLPLAKLIISVSFRIASLLAVVCMATCVRLKMSSVT